MLEGSEKTRWIAEIAARKPCGRGVQRDHDEGETHRSDDACTAVPAGSRETSECLPQYKEEYADDDLQEGRRVRGSRAIPRLPDQDGKRSQSFDIRHPEMILVGRSSVRVYTATGDDAHEKWHDVSLMLMETIEPMEAVVSV